MNKKLIIIVIISVVLLGFYLSSFAQVKIDKQQCFGGIGADYGFGIAECDNGFLVLGLLQDISLGTGLVQCDDSISRTWVVKINDDYMFVDAWCYRMGNLNLKIFKDRNKPNEFFLVGGGECYNANNLKTIKIDSNGNELWSCCFGNEYGNQYEGGRLYTNDGGIINSGVYSMEGGDVGQVFYGYDGWMVKHDSLGNMEWELTLGSDGINERICSIEQASDNGYYVCMYNESVGEGNVLCLPTEVPNAALVKLNQSGEIEWQECYGCQFTSPGNWERSDIESVIELKDGGFLYAGHAACNSGDLEGSGWHFGTINNIPNGRYTNDIWLWRVDADHNILWSKCYGGSDNEYLGKILQTEDEGFIVFGATHSNNGDVASASHIDLHSPNEGAAWVFRIDANGNLLWERCMGTEQLGQTEILDVLRHNDREYTIVGRMFCPSYEGISGDINCSNCRQLFNPESPHNSWNYWVAHITDTVDYNTLHMPEQLLPQKGEVVKIYPNPTKNTVCVVLSHETKATEMELFNMSGQIVANKVFCGISGWMETSNLPKGMYVLKIRNAEVCITQMVLKE